MSGRYGARGYVYQALIAVFKCFQYNSWDKIKVEPLTEHDKVDISLKKNEVLIRAIQVKSSINKLEKPNIERCIDEIKKDVRAIEYELVLVADSFTKPAIEFIQKINSDKINNIYIEIIEDGEQGIERLAKSYFIEFLEHYNPECSITVNMVDNILNNIFATLIKFSAKENWFTKNDFLNIINKNIISAIRRKKRFSVKKVSYMRFLNFLPAYSSCHIYYTNLHAANAATAPSAVAVVICLTVLVLQSPATNIPV